MDQIENQDATSARLSRFADFFSRYKFLSGGAVSEWIFYIALFLLPIWSLPVTIFPIDLNKSFLAYFLVIIGGILFLSNILKEGKINIPKNWFFVSIFALVLVFAVSGLFSISKTSSFLGLGHEASSASAILLFSLAAFFAALIFNSDEKSMKGFWAIFISFIALALFQIFQTFFKFSLFSWIGSDVTRNLFGSWNELAIFSSLVMFLSLVFYSYLPRSGMRTLSGILFFISLAFSALINYAPVWWVSAIFLIVFMTHLYLRTRDPRSIFGLPMVALIAVVFLVLAQPLVTRIGASLGVQFVEVRPSWSSTGDIIVGAFKHNILLGTGPNTFVYDWFNFRSLDITRTPFWQVRFSTGVGLLPTWVLSTGLLGALALVAVLALFIWYGFKALVREEYKATFLMLASFLGALYLWVFLLIYPASFLTAFLTFVFSGMFIGLATSKGSLPTLQISIFERSGLGFVSALSIIFMIILGISWFYILAGRYYSHVAYAKGVEALGRGNYDRAEKYLNNAIGASRLDRYYRTYTDLGLIRLRGIVNRSDLSQNELRTRFQNTLGTVIQNAQAATSLNPADPVNWMNLGNVYGSIVPLGVQGASDSAFKAYDEALARFPTSPEPYFIEAQIKIVENDLVGAKELLRKSIAIKDDYTQAHFLLAQTEVQLGDLPKAINSSETTVFLSPNDIGALFQLGLLYYQSQRYDEAEAVLERAVSLNENYSNARYFLGLIYARAKDNKRALGEFEKILNLNPDSNEVRQIISNLKENKAPLDGISPPAPAPEKRKSPPLDEKGPKNTTPTE